MTIGYFCVFYLSTVYDPNDLDVLLFSYRVALIFLIQSALYPAYLPFQFLSSISLDIDTLITAN